MLHLDQISYPLQSDVHCGQGLVDFCGGVCQCQQGSQKVVGPECTLLDKHFIRKAGRYLHIWL